VAGFWEDEPFVLAGRDLQSGGTWLGITKEGRIAAVTNYHETIAINSSLLSRGALVSDFLRRDIEPRSYADILADNGKWYGGFNIVFGTMGDFYYCSNRREGYELLEPGIHGLSNRVLNDDAFKVRKGRELMKCLLSKGSVSADDLFSLLDDRDQEPGLKISSRTGTEEERFYSPMFIAGKKYGTRCSTVILIDKEGNVFFSEREFSSEGEQTETVEYEFRVGD
jgi:uncharacterized protein with NRDE domain